MKKEYQSILEEAKGLEDHFRQLLKKLEKNPSKEEELDVNERKIQYRKELSEKKAQLEELKKTYLDIEKESFLIRKELHQEGCFI